MLHYVVRTFREVVFVHCAANIDTAFLNLVQPNYLLTQSNGRFLVRPPSVRYKLMNDIATKWAKLDETVKHDKQTAVQQQLANLPATAEWVNEIHQYSLEPLLRSSAQSKF